MLEPQGMAAIRDAEWEATFGLCQSLLSVELRRAKEADLARERRRARWAFSAVLRRVSHRLSARVGIVPPKPAGPASATCC